MHPQHQDMIKLEAGRAGAPPPQPHGQQGPNASHLPLAVHGPAEHKGGLPAVLQDPQSLALLKSNVPHSVLESQLLSVSQLLSAGVELEDVDHGNAFRKEREKNDHN